MNLCQSTLPTAAIQKVKQHAGFEALLSLACVARCIHVATTKSLYKMPSFGHSSRPLCNRLAITPLLLSRTSNLLTKYILIYLVNRWHSQICFHVITRYSTSVQSLFNWSFHLNSLSDTKIMLVISMQFKIIQLPRAITGAILPQQDASLLRKL